MKNYILLLTFVATSSVAFSQAVDLKINPLALTWGTVSGSAEFVLSESFGLEVSGLAASGEVRQNNENFERKGSGIILSGKYYLEPYNIGDGFYVGAYTRYRERNYESIASNNAFNTRKIALGVTGGYKWIISDFFVVETGAGIGYNALNKVEITAFDNSGDFPIGSIPAVGIDFLIRISVGYRFGGR